MKRMALLLSGAALALAACAEVPPPASAAADALRDGWDTARLTAGSPSDPTDPVSRDRRAGR